MDELAARSAFETAMNSNADEFGNFFLVRFLGIEITYTDENCTASCEPKDFMFNPQGTLHGGLIATLLDVSMGHLLKYSRGPGVTIDMNVQYLRAIRHGRISAEAQFTKSGRELCFMRSVVTNDSGDSMALATSTWKLL